MLSARHSKLGLPVFLLVVKIYFLVSESSGAISGAHFHNSFLSGVGLLIFGVS